MRVKIYPEVIIMVVYVVEPSINVLNDVFTAFFCMGKLR